MSRFEIRKSRDGKFYFVLIAKNNKVILQSETYLRMLGAKRGIASIKMLAVDAPVVDKTV